jgi:hypothetical protein
MPQQTLAFYKQYNDENVAREHLRKMVDCGADYANELLPDNGRYETIQDLANRIHNVKLLCNNHPTVCAFVDMCMAYMIALDIQLSKVLNPD